MGFRTLLLASAAVCAAQGDNETNSTEEPGVNSTAAAGGPTQPPGNSTSNTTTTTDPAGVGGSTGAEAWEWWNLDLDDVTGLVRDAPAGPALPHARAGGTPQS